MKRLFQLTVCLFIAINAFSQESSKSFRIHGIVTDSLTGANLAKASLTIKPAGQNAGRTLKTSTGNSGEFSVLLDSSKSYEFTASYIGYVTRTKTVEASELTAQKDIVILLTATAKSLQAVSVVAKKPVIENKPDRLIYNAERDVTSQMGTAIDVLRKVPQVTVDIDGNVELMGNPSVRFLINGKTSLSFGSSLADALQAIPSSQIQSIEVITSPGAKYDASGTGGIINIVLKKNRLEGISGMISATAGSRQENGSSNLNYKKDKLALSGFIGGSVQLKSQSLSESQRTTNDPLHQQVFKLIQDGSGTYLRQGSRAGLSLDWDLRESENISMTWNHNSFGNTNEGLSNQQHITENSLGQLVFQDNNLRQVYNKYRNGEDEASIDYLKKWKKSNKELKISYNFGGEDNYTAYDQKNSLYNNAPITYGAKSENPGKLYMSEFSADYTSPISKTFTWETGLKSVLETIESNSDVFSYSTTQNKYLLDTFQTYTSRFNRQIYAAYSSASFQLLKTLDVVAGVRWEHTVNKTRYSKDASIHIPDYNNLAPDLILSHKFENGQLIKLSYTYRLERPEYRDLNPFVNLSDPHTISTGNPLIKPEIGNEFQFGYNRPLGNDNNLNMVLAFTYNNPDIKSYTTFYPSFKIGDSIFTDVNLTKRDNIASEFRWGLNTSVSINSVPHLSIRANIQLYERTTKNIYANPVYATGFEYRTNMNVNYQFNRGIVAEAFGNYNSGIHWQGKRAPFYSYNMAVKKQLLKGKASLGITAANAFGKYLIQKTIMTGPNYDGYSLFRVPFRSFGINFQYRFGKLKITKPKEEENLMNKPPEG